MRRIVNTDKNKQGTVYRSIEEFLKFEPEYRDFMDMGATFVIREKDYVGCGECPYCTEHSEMAKDQNLKVIVNRQTWDIVALIEINHE